MNKLPPLLPVYPENDNSMASGAATICLVSPLVVLTLFEALGRYGNKLAAPHQAIVVAIFGGVSCVLILSGLILGILALLVMRPGGRASITVRSLMGLGITVLIGFMAVPNYQQAKVRARALSDAAQAANDAITASQQRAAADLAAQTNQAGSVVRAERTLSQAADATTGEQALKLKALEAYLEHGDAVLGDYQKAHDQLMEARVLATSNLVARSLIQQRRAVVLQFLECNNALDDFTSHAEVNLRAELTARHLPEATISSTVDGFSKPAAPQRPIASEIRTQDERLGLAMLGVLDLLDSNWGHWRYTTNLPHLHFDSPSALDQYNTYLGEIHEAELTQTASQRHLAGAMQQAMNR